MSKVDLDPLFGIMSMPAYNITLELTSDHMYLYPWHFSKSSLGRDRAPLYNNALQGKHLGNSNSEAIPSLERSSQPQPQLTGPSLNTPHVLQGRISLPHGETEAVDVDQRRNHALHAGWLLAPPSIPTNQGLCMGQFRIPICSTRDRLGQTWPTIRATLC